MRLSQATNIHLQELADFRARIKRALADAQLDTLTGLTKLLPLYLKIVELERDLRAGGNARRANAQAEKEKKQAKQNPSLSEQEWLMLEELVLSRGKDAARAED